MNDTRRGDFTRCSFLFLLAVGVIVGMLGCDQDADLYACDIRKETCQDDIFYAVARLRGTLWDPWLDRPPTRVITADDYRAELLAAQEQAQQGEATYDYFEAAKELLGLLDPDRTTTSSIDAQVANVAAYYDFGPGEVTIIDHGDSGDLTVGTYILGHELVHAAQDRELGLAFFGSSDTYDGYYARRAIIEGEARLYENLLQLELQRLDVEQADWAGYHERLLANAREDVFLAESPEFELYGLLYPLGAIFLTDRYLEDGNQAVRDVWADLPVQVGQLLGGGHGAMPEPLPLLDCQAPSAPTGYEYRTQAVMGALPFFGVSTRLADSVASAWAMAEALQGDRLYVYARDEAHTTLVWHLSIETAQREAVLEAAQGYYGAGAVELVDDRITVVLSTEAELPEWEDARSCSGAN